MRSVVDVNMTAVDVCNREAAPVIDVRSSGVDMRRDYRALGVGATEGLTLRLTLTLDGTGLGPTTIGGRVRCVHEGTERNGCWRFARSKLRCGMVGVFGRKVANKSQGACEEF